MEAQQSKAKKETEAKDRQLFEKFTTKSSSDTTECTIVQDTKVNGDIGHTPFIGSAPSVTNTPMSGFSKPRIVEVSKSDSPSELETTLSSSKTADSGNLSKTRVQKSQNQTSGLKPNSPHEGVGSTSIASVLEREPAQTSFQFQADFKILKNDLLAFYSYFKRIDPSLYPKLFGQSLEAPILLKIVEAIHQCCIPANEDCYQQLKSLSEVKRFAMISMFLSFTEKQGIREVFQYLKTRALQPQSDIEALMKKYEV